MLDREHSEKVSKKFIGNFYFWGITLNAAQKQKSANYSEIITCAFSSADTILKSVHRIPSVQWRSTKVVSKGKLICKKLINWIKVYLTLLESVFLKCRYLSKMDYIRNSGLGSWLFCLVLMLSENFTRERPRKSQSESSISTLAVPCRTATVT